MSDRPTHREQPPSEDPTHDHPTTPIGAPFAPPSAGPPLFAPGDRVGGRYEILRFIARGGMGEVYAAEDRELGTRVALKTIRPELAAREGTIERFKREILIARQVTHRNVCRIFDLGRHTLPAAGSAPPLEVTFLTMELLDGETLSHRLARVGRMTTAEALPVVTQMAGALVAAHRAGVVHRDFKSSNVMLVATESDVRAVVTDFGLARIASPVPLSDMSSTPTGFVLGTPAYIAPEQVDGSNVTASADIYALGVVVFEMVTGRTPFAGDHPLAIVVKRLKDPAPSPRKYVPDLDRSWEAGILRCLEREPRARYATADQLVSAITGAPAAGPDRDAWAEMPTGQLPPRRRRGRLAAAAAAVLALAAGAAGWRQARDATPALPGREPTATQVTSSAGLDLQPSFSPDARLLAYSSDRGGAFEIYVRSLASGRDRAVTSDGQQNFQPAWSPDGRVLAYHAKSRGGIWVVPAEGGAPRQLTTFGSRPAWSPSGKRVAFQSEALVDAAPNAVGAMPPSSLWTVPAEGGEPTQVTQPGSPAGGHGAPCWSPDERHLAFTVSDRHTSVVWSVSLDGSELVRVADEQVYAFDPVFAPDARRIYYSAVSDSGHFGLWMIPMAPGTARPGGPPVRLADLGSSVGRHLALSRDGRRLAYSTLQLTSNLRRLSLRTGADLPPLTAETGRNARPVFSPDGRRIAFDRWRAGANGDVWVMDRDGGNAMPLTSHPAVDTAPTWSPDGRRVFFRSDRSGHPALWSIDLQTRAETMVLDPGQDLDWPRVSPDGAVLAFNSRKGGGTINVWTSAPLPSPPRQITFDSQSLGFPVWSPDGTVLALELKRGEQSQIAIVPRDGGPPVELTHGPGQSWPYSFSPDGAQIAFAGLRKGYWNLYAISRKTGEERALTRYARLNAYVRSPAWSPQGDEMVYEFAETTGNVWMMDDLP